MKRKVLIYSPYSQAMPHVLHEITIAKGLQLRGAEVLYIGCNSVFTDCDAHWKRWSPRTTESCKNCMSVAEIRLTNYKLPYEWLGQYLSENDFISVQQWCNKIAPDGLITSKYKGYPVGEYGLSSLASHYRLSKVELNNQNILDTYKSYVSSGALAVEAFSRLLDKHKPDTLLMFNGRFFSHNLLLQLSRERNISVYIHERGWVDDTIRLKINENVLTSDTFRQTWKAWEEIPLTSEELHRIDRMFSQRKQGKNTNWFSFVHASHDISRIYEELRIAKDKKIITLFTSSTDEVIGAPEFKVIIDQDKLISHAIKFFKKKNDYCLVIRLHPNTASSDGLVSDLKNLSKSFPANVKLVLPDDAINSYQLLRVSEACIVFMSTIGLEAAADGKRVLMCGSSIYYGQSYSLNLPSADACELYFERLLSEGNPVETIRSAYRYGYHIFFRTCIPFPLVETTEVFKSKVTYPSPDVLTRGFDETLDRICDAILENRSVDLLPDSSYSRDTTDEDKFFAGKTRPVRSDNNGEAETSDEPQRILFVCHNIPPYEYSGTPIITLSQAGEMMGRGKEVAVLIPSTEVSGTFYEETAADGLRIFKIPKIDRRWSFFEELTHPEIAAKHVVMVMEILREFMPDVIHVNDSVDLPITIFEAFASSNAVVIREVWNDEEICFRVSPIVEETRETCSGPESIRKCADCHAKTSPADADLENKLELHRGYIDHVYRDVIDGVVFASNMFKEHFRRFVDIAEEKITTIACGLHLEWITDARPRQGKLKELVFTFMGNFFEFRKGLDVLLNACLQLDPASGIKVRIFGYGRKNALDEIERVSTLTNGMLEYRGRYSSRELPEIMENTDVGVVTSYFESYCLVLREFLSCGKPVIATKFCGTEIIDDGKNGLLIDPGDADALADAMKSIAEDCSLLDVLSKGALETAIPSPGREAEGLLSYYSKIWAKSRKRYTESSILSYCSSPAPETATNPRLIAFHLPQFHSIPENDVWWGEGFTEWTNVRKARPLFPGHYQPHEPSDLGYYDLRDPKALNAQAALAREYGIYGFCYYHYWFNGKLLLETPLHEMLSSGEPDFPFCLCWANEDWTRAWDGRSGEILISQNYCEEDDIRHFHYLRSFFEDKRYIRIDGKPLFLIYRANRLSDSLGTTTRWRELARKSGLGELYLCRVESFADEHTNPHEAGFDAAIEFQPDWRELGDKLAGERYVDHSVYEYSSVVRKMIQKPDPGYKRFPCVTPSWDNSPRRKSGAVVFVDSNPLLYKSWLLNAMDKVRTLQADERIVFINAWNEWGEGNHLEPDAKNGRAYLEATKSALFDTVPYKHRDDGYSTPKMLPSDVNMSLFSEYRNLFDTIEGWFMWEAVELLTYFNEIQKKETIGGDLFEIGAYKGKLTLMLMTFVRPGETLFVNDIFDMQHLNISQSGCGANLTDFINNVKKLDTDPSYLRLLIKPSDAIDPSETGGNIRFISIDGGHSELETYNDLSLSAKILHPLGIIVVDDIFHEDWPGVKSGVNRFLAEFDDMTPLAVFFNKLIIVRVSAYDVYSKHLSLPIFDSLMSGYLSSVNDTLFAGFECFAISRKSSSTGSKGIKSCEASIIIPVFNNIDYTRKCINAIRRDPPRVSCEIIVVDNASTDGTSAYLREPDQNVRVLTNAENLGYTIACNQGANAANGRYLVFLNNDTEPQPGWLDSLVLLADGDPSIGAAGAKLVYPDGSLQEAGAIVFRDGTALNFGRGDDPSKEDYNKICEVDYCSGACLLVRHDLFTDIGMFDERFAPGYYEETDLCFRLRQHGYKVVYCPEATVSHHGSVTAGLDPDAGLRRYLRINKEKFVEKWRHELELHILPTAASGCRIATADRNSLRKTFDDFLRLSAIGKKEISIGLHAQTLDRIDGVIAGSEITTHCLMKAFLRHPEVKSVHRYGPGNYSALATDELDLMIIEGWDATIPSFIAYLRQNKPGCLIFFWNLSFLGFEEICVLDVDGYLTNSRKNEEILQKRRPTKFVMLSADPDDFAPVAIDPEYRHDVVYLGMYHPHKSLDIMDRILLEASEFDLGIYGNRWDEHPYLSKFWKGRLPRGHISRLYSSAKIVLGTTEDRQRDAGMINNRVFEALSCGACFLSEYYPELEETFGDAMLYSKQKGDTTRLLKELLGNDKARQDMGRRGRNLVVSKHTYDLRAQDIFTLYQSVRGVGVKEENICPPIQQKIRLPSISIVIPSYNRAQFLPDAIRSALAQSYQNFEVVVVDDGSIDNTPDIIEKLQDKRLRYVRKDHSGAPATRNRCISESEGEYLLWLDSDDMLLPDTLSTYVEVLSRTPDANVIYGNLIVTDHQGRQNDELHYRDWYGCNTELLASLFFSNCIPNPGTMVKKSLYSKMGGYDESYRRAHDYELWTRIALTANFKHVPVNVVRWRWHDANMSTGSVHLDTSFEAKIIKAMVENFSLQQLFPFLEWSDPLIVKTEALAWICVAKRLLELRDTAGAVECARRSHLLYSVPETLEILKEIQSMAP